MDKDSPGEFVIRKVSVDLTESIDRLWFSVFGAGFVAGALFSCAVYFFACYCST